LLFSFKYDTMRMKFPLFGKTCWLMRIYYNRGHIDYAYQFFTDAPLLRWDNKEEFHHLATYPHHHHDELGNVKPSPLIGDPIKDIKQLSKNIGVSFERLIQYLYHYTKLNAKRRKCKDLEVLNPKNLMK